MQIRDATILVTGASSGIGRATALELARRGATVLCVARTATKLDALVAEITDAGGSAAAFPTDLSDPAAVAEMADRVMGAHGAPDALVNNAGAGRWRAVEETDLEEVAQMMGAPYFAAFYVTRVFLPAMIARGSGHILNVNSPAGLMAFPGAAGYAATRTALRTFDDALGLELRGTGVGVTHLIAGEVSSAYFAHNPDSHDRIPAIARWFPVLTPEQVAGIIAEALVSEKRTVVKPFALWLTWVSFELAPWLVRRIVWATSWKRPRRV